MGAKLRVLESEYPPLLPGGFHDMEVAALRRLCVDRFPLSITRRGIMEGLEAVFQRVMRAGLVMQAWVDGSFLTEKLNPRDSDVVFRVALEDWNAASSDQKAVVFWINQTDMKTIHHCDAYAFVDEASGPALDDSEWMRAYWIRQWGFSRTQEPKGVAVITLPYVII